MIGSVRGIRSISESLDQLKLGRLHVRTRTALGPEAERSFLLARYTISSATLHTSRAINNQHYFSFRPRNTLLNDIYSRQIDKSEKELISVGAKLKTLGVDVSEFRIPDLTSRSRREPNFQFSTGAYCKGEPSSKTKSKCYKDRSERIDLNLNEQEVNDAFDDIVSSFKDEVADNFMNQSMTSTVEEEKAQRKKAIDEEINRYFPMPEASQEPTRANGRSGSLYKTRVKFIPDPMGIYIQN